MSEKEFKKAYKKLRKLMKKGKCTGFIGYGYMPVCGKPAYCIPIMKQLDICLYYEPFLEYLRSGFDDE